MIDFLYSKKGSTSVFLVMILSSVLLLVGLFIHAASQAAGRSCTDAVLDLAGRSVLSEYDIPLQNRYGIFAFHTDEREAEEKLKYYAEYSFHDNALKEVLRRNRHMDLLKLDLESVNVDLKGYSITDTDLFEQQILAHMKYDILGAVGERPDLKASSAEDIVLKNEKVINSLPSRGYSSGILTDLERIVKNGIPDLKEIEQTAKNTFLVDEYLMRHFGNHCRSAEARETFFINEVEYVLKGNHSDQRNYSAVRTDLFLVRNVLNLIHINSDSEKRQAVSVIAAALTLARGEKIAAPIVAEAWAAAEAENDLRLLEDGKQVAFIKKKENWAVPISETLEYLWKDDYITPKTVRGYDYEDYLRVLLFLENREKKLLRCMDLIQLNMQGSYRRDFDLRQYYGGFQFKALVREREYSYIEKY